MSHIRFHPFASLILALAMVLAGVAPAFADSPPNDDFDSPKVILELPFTDSMDTSEATAACEDPISCTNYFQVGTLYGDGGLFGFNLEVAPPPVAGMYFYPSDPSSYDNVQFCDGSYDPGEMDFQSFDWDFGDGVAITTTDWCVHHRYAADGDFTVQHTGTTVDGRTASASQTVQVRKHDVSISRVLAPRSAKVGQTRPVTVSLQNTRYQETVRIELYRSVPEGFEWIATSTQFVPIRPGKRTTQFTFNYTFRPQDAQIGKVTFKAIAMIEDGRDALPADNEAISAPPTIVNR
jgi:hypothetical protein